MTQQTVKNKAETLVEVRCKNCDKLLAMLPADAPYRIKCQRCKMMNDKGKTDGE